jgi:hypothetical protein
MDWKQRVTKRIPNRNVTHLSSADCCCGETVRPHWVTVGSQDDFLFVETLRILKLLKYRVREEIEKLNHYPLQDLRFTRVWVVTPCRLLGRYQRFWETSRLCPRCHPCLIWSPVPPLNLSNTLIMLFVLFPLNVSNSNFQTLCPFSVAFKEFMSEVVCNFS